MAIGDRIKELRKSHGYTQEELGEKLGKPVEQLTELEQNEALNNIGLSVLDMNIP